MGIAELAQRKWRSLMLFTEVTVKLSAKKVLSVVVWIRKGERDPIFSVRGLKLRVQTVDTKELFSHPDTGPELVSIVFSIVYFFSEQ